MRKSKSASKSSKRSSRKSRRISKVRKRVLVRRKSSARQRKRKRSSNTKKRKMPSASSKKVKVVSKKATKSPKKAAKKVSKKGKDKKDKKVWEIKYSQCTCQIHTFELTFYVNLWIFVKVAKKKFEIDGPLSTETPFAKDLVAKNDLVRERLQLLITCQHFPTIVHVNLIFFHESSLNIFQNVICLPSQGF